MAVHRRRLGPTPDIAAAGRASAPRAARRPGLRRRARPVDEHDTRPPRRGARLSWRPSTRASRPLDAARLHRRHRTGTPSGQELRTRTDARRADLAPARTRGRDPRWPSPATTPAHRHRARPGRLLPLPAHRSDIGPRTATPAGRAPPDRRWPCCASAGATPFQRRPDATSPTSSSPTPPPFPADRPNRTASCRVDAWTESLDRTRPAPGQIALIGVFEPGPLCGATKRLDVARGAGGAGSSHTALA